MFIGIGVDGDDLVIGVDLCVGDGGNISWDLC